MSQQHGHRYGLIWPGIEPVPASWAEQGLEFSPDAFGIPQGKNGPCGVLAAVHAVVAAQAGAELGPNMRVSDEALASALTAIIAQCRPSPEAPCILTTWPEAKLVPNPNVCEYTSDDLASVVLSNIGQFKAAGGCVLLMYSCVLTRTPDQVKKDLAAEMENGPLVLAPTFVCSMGLMGLILKGAARGTISAYAAIGGQPLDWPAALGVGMLSFSEVDSGVPLCNTLKNPTHPVWVLHGGDHFTVLFSTKDIKSEIVELWHYNGLPPSGPRMCKIMLKSKGVAPLAPEGPREDSFMPPVPGQIEGVVQCNPQDKSARPGEWTTWSYEVVLAVEDLDYSIYGKGTRERNPDDPMPQIFSLGELPNENAWRCASCYRGRFKTMCFGQNEPGNLVCKFCGKAQLDAGWSLWLPYDQLPPGKKASVTAQHAPKIHTLLNTKWCLDGEPSFDGDGPPGV